MEIFFSSKVTRQNYGRGRRHSFWSPHPLSPPRKKHFHTKARHVLRREEGSGIETSPCSTWYLGEGGLIQLSYVIRRCKGALWMEASFAVWEREEEEETTAGKKRKEESLL